MTMTRATPETLEFPNPDPPKPGEAIEVRPGVLWARFPRPCRLDHVNIYLIDDGDGLAVVDAGIDNAQSRAAWEALLEGSDACFAPVLSLAEAAAHPHNAARGLYAHRPNGELDAAGAPRFLPLC